MNTWFLQAITAIALAASACGENVQSPSSPHADVATQNAALIGVADFSGMQVSGVTVSESGRVFATFPRWREGVGASVVEVKTDGSWSPYPDFAWNTWTGSPRENGFTCVQTVFAHGDSLYVLDPSNPMFRGVIASAILYEFDLKTNTLKNSWKFDEKSAPPRSYLNNLSVDAGRDLVYISDSGLGAIVVLNTKTGKTWRVLENSPSTKSEVMTLFSNGKPLLKANGAPMRIHVNGLALYGGYLYYHSVTARHLYRIPTDALANPALPQLVSASLVEDLGPTPPPDGMIFDKVGNLYMGDLEKNAVVYRTPQGEFRTLIRFNELQWVDTLAMSPANELLFTDSRLGSAKPGTSVNGITFSIYKVAMPR